jgi:regulator of cell morphogenesis and NO signaling
MIINENLTVAEIVNEKPNAAIIFKKHKIDFCCGGKKPLAEACAKAKVDEKVVLSEIAQLNSSGDSMMRVFSWPLSLLCDYIVSNHHTYVKEVIPQLLPLAEKVARVHGHEQTQLLEVFEKFQALASELHQHMIKEEQELFPLVKKLEAEGKLNESEWKQLIAELEDEHEAAGNLMKEIQELTNDFQYPDWACNSFRALYKNLEEFQDDLFQHVHLENNVLFPKIESRY